MATTITLAVLALTAAQEAEVQTAARLIAESDLAVGFPLTVERIYGDYEFGGEQSTPGYMDVWYYRTREDRDVAKAQAEPLVKAFQEELGDEFSVWGECRPTLVPRDRLMAAGSPFTVHLLRPMVEGSGADFDEIGDRIFEHLIV